MPAIKPRDIPGRLVAGAYILHTGLGKWNVDAEGAAGLHATAAGAFPFLRPIPPKQFATLLSATEITVGTVLLAPVIPTAVAGLALTGFAGALVTMYLRTPTMHETGSIWPSRSGIGVSKDSWLLAMGVGLLIDSVGRRPRERRRIAKAAARMRADADLVEAHQPDPD
jgi:uncharacterized membrane protein YphA (DoxX/SURF4 family)